RVFGPTTTTRHVYDVAARYVVSGAMEGINGTIFAYGVTSSGKTHTMHGDQRSPGLIPLVVKDTFNIIQETPNRVFLLRVSYLEIYNEVVNDLLNPAGQNLRIRDNLQGTFVEGIREEVVLSPVHALSLIAAGEEHRHVGSTNFNLLSSRSHTIFTLTIESSPCGQSSEGEAVMFSQLNLIDLAGSESSRAETTGVRQKEGSYINKSLLTLGTVISKLIDEKATHIPFRDSKLTRLLQSSLSGQGRVSLICTVTPASSNSEETRNTLKFAHRAKHIEIQATQNKIMDAKSLIKKYQHEICRLKEELEQMKRGVLIGIPLKDATQETIIHWKQKLEDGHVKLQSRLEQEEAKAALLGRIEHLTKLILVSTKANLSTKSSQHPGPRRSHSFGEELAYLPCKRRDIMLDKSNVLFNPIEGFGETLKIFPKEEIKNRKGLLNWLKFQVSRKTSDHVDLLGEQFNILSGEVALHLSVLKHLSEEAGKNAMNEHVEMEMKVVNDQINHIKQQIASIERRIARAMSDRQGKHDNLEFSWPYTEILGQLNEKAFKLEVKTADNRIMQGLLKQKASECHELQETTADLKEQLSQALEVNALLSERNTFQHNTDIDHVVGSQAHKEKPLPRDVPDELLDKALQAEIDGLKQGLHELTEAKAQLESRIQKLLSENTYTKDLTSVAGAELKALSEEFTKLMKHNERLTSELASAKNSTQRRLSHGVRGARRESHIKRHEPANKRDTNACSEREQALEAMLMEKDQREAELRMKIEESKQKEAFLEGELANMWAVLANSRKAGANYQEDFDAKYNGSWA
ncbi:hypothetical protein GUJ93_ZPchr0012g19795, partial [Zizania palustris]